LEKIVNLKTDKKPLKRRKKPRLQDQETEPNRKELW